MKKRNSEFHIFTQHFCQRNDLHDNSTISIVVSYFSDDQLLLNYLICCSKAAVNLNCDRLSAALPASEHWNFQVFPAVSSLYKHNMHVKKKYIYILLSYWKPSNKCQASITFSHFWNVKEQWRIDIKVKLLGVTSLYNYSAWLMYMAFTSVLYRT